ncbi:MAG: hypothetical protein ABSG03_12875 [Bryobacteraceae bacterium]|jgi:hypothetical protein
MISDPTLLLGGFTLAHALGSIADVDELLCPLALVERHGKRELLRFEADTQEEAISAGKEHLRANVVDADRWAFAREGLLNLDGSKVDVMAVDLMDKTLPKPIELIQMYEPFAKRGRFRVIGEPTIVIDTVTQDRDVMDQLLPKIREGVQEHGIVAPLWSGWGGW